MAYAMERMNKCWPVAAWHLLLSNICLISSVGFGNRCVFSTSRIIWIGRCPESEPIICFQSKVKSRNYKRNEERQSVILFLVHFSVSVYLLELYCFGFMSMLWPHWSYLNKRWTHSTGWAWLIWLTGADPIQIYSPIFSLQCRKLLLAKTMLLPKRS